MELQYIYLKCIFNFFGTLVVKLYFALNKCEIYPIKLVCIVKYKLQNFTCLMHDIIHDIMHDIP